MINTTFVAWHPGRQGRECTFIDSTKIYLAPSVPGTVLDPTGHKVSPYPCGVCVLVGVEMEISMLPQKLCKSQTFDHYLLSAYYVQVMSTRYCNRHLGSGTQP